MSTDATSFPPSSPIANITIPSTPLIKATFKYVTQHTSPVAVNHVARSAILALLIASKILPLAPPTTNPETIVVATLLHDMGWSTTPGLTSNDKRFEVDGANLARDFLRNEVAKGDDAVAMKENGWNDEARLQLIWDAIALHSTPSIAMHKQPDVMLVAYGIIADFLGPTVEGPPGLITPDEFRDILRAFPRLGFREEVKQIMCGLCRTKPEATFDNFVGEYGARFVEGYGAEREKRNIVDMLDRGLQATEAYE